ncbi:DUF1631 family protein [Cognatilysobacter bugurensis]|uniref:DUF1631 domain-containing protein n=1 Tax=Cognatilysobacter bugurensis TaxID=543356 RepID=A0A918T1T9_9GAMM|nr:DUF1631 family protein [Lysobacter bugurensis]GHA84860.1 hypothetical protein GCM10007067_23500 [Lysobacter bugurensis]
MSVPLQPFTHSRQTPSLASAALPRRVRETLQEVLTLVIDHAVGPLERVLDDLELELNRGAQEVDDFTRRIERLGRFRALQRERHGIAPRFIDLLEAELATLRDPMPAPPPRPARPDEVPGTEWRLLEDDEAQDSTLLQTITLRYEARAGLALQLLGYRFGVLAGRPALDSEHLPVGPYRLTTLIGAASDAAGLDGDVRRRLMTLFEQRVLARYEDLAATMNALLVRRGVLPSMNFVPIRVRPRTAAAGDNALSTAPATTESVAVPFDLLRSLLAHRRAAVNRFRAPPLGRGPEGADAWRSAALPGFGDAEGHAAPGPDDTSADALELVELWYGRIVREVPPGSIGASWLDALHPAVVQAAVQDPHVFDHADHPVRQLLDAVIEASGSAGADEPLDPTLQSALTRAVDDVVAAGGAPHAFQSANDGVQHARRTLARRAEVAERRLVEAARGRERLAEARLRVARVIAELSQGRALPRVIRTLVDQAWADVLTLTALRNGEDGDDWRRKLETTRQILDVATGAPAPPGLAERIHDALSAIGTHEQEARMIAAHLGASEIGDDDSAATRTELMMRLKARTRLGAETPPEPLQRTPLTPEQGARLAELPVGDADAWFEFAPERDGLPSVRRRLVWTGAATNTALFVNRRGQRTAEIALDALACELDAGRVRLVAQDARSGVERAWNAVLATLSGFDPDRGAPHA